MGIALEIWNSLYIPDKGSDIVGTYQITKKDFYNSGGFSNPKQFRKAITSGVWVYRRFYE